MTDRVGEAAALPHRDAAVSQQVGSREEKREETKNRRDSDSAHRDRQDKRTRTTEWKLTQSSGASGPASHPASATQRSPQTDPVQGQQLAAA
eukprot:1534445-Rhodomonas_salina.2